MISLRGGRLLWQQKLCPRISQLKTSRLHGQDVLFAAHLSRSPQLRFSGEDLLLVVVSREFFGPFVRIPYLKKNRCQENRWKKNISHNHLPTIHWPSRRFLKGPWCPSHSKLFTSMLKPAGPPKKKHNKDAAGVPFTGNQPPENRGTVKPRGLIGQLHKVFDIGRINFLYKSSVRSENPQMRNVKIVDLLRLKDWKNLQSTRGCKRTSYVWYINIALAEPVNICQKKQQAKSTEIRTGFPCYQNPEIKYTMKVQISCPTWLNQVFLCISKYLGSLHKKNNKRRTQQKKNSPIFTKGQTKGTSVFSPPFLAVLELAGYEKAAHHRQL